MNSPAEKITLGSKTSCFAVLAVIAVTCLLIYFMPVDFWDGLDLREAFLLGLSAVTFIGLPLWLVVTGMKDSRAEGPEHDADINHAAFMGTIVPYHQDGTHLQRHQFTKLPSDQQGWLAAVVGLMLSLLFIVCGASLLAGNSILWGMPGITLGLVMGYGAVTTFGRWAKFGRTIVKVSATTVAPDEDFLVAIFSSKRLSIEKLRVELVWKIYLPEDDEEPADERVYPVAELRNLVSTPGEAVAFLKVKAPEAGLPGEKVENRWITWDIRIRMNLPGDKHMVDDFHLCVA